LHVEARPSEFAHMGNKLDRIAELDRNQETGASVHERNTGDFIRSEEFRPRHAEHGLEQLPGTLVEEFEEAAVEHDAGRIAGAPFDREPPAVHCGYCRVCRKYRRSGGSCPFLVGIKSPSALRKYASLPMATCILPTLQMFCTRSALSV